MSSAEQVRQQKVTERRKASGYQTKKYHFFERDLTRLDKIAVNMGYDPTTRRSAEDYTAIIRSCIAEVYSRMEPTETVVVPKNHEEAYLYELKQIVQFRIKQCGNLEDVTKFMKESRYPVPTGTNKRLRKLSEEYRQNWCNELVQALTSKKNG